jgi:FkbM family methyltransferase
MKQQIILFLQKLIRKLNPAYHVAKNSWSQQGEDLCVLFIFRWLLGVEQFTYLDIGANHPHYLSNTYLFYTMGMTGVCVEPNPDLVPLFKVSRPKDQLFNIGIGSHSGDLDFYMMTSNTLNTFSRKQAEAYTKDKSMGSQQIEKVVQIPVESVNTILERCFRNEENYFLSIDVEGMDLEILNAINFELHRPTVICVESNGEDESFMTLMTENRYVCHLSNGTNLIFVDGNRLNRHAS